MEMLSKSFVNRYKRVQAPAIQGGQSSIRRAIDTQNSNQEVIIKKFHFEQSISEAALNEIHTLSLPPIKNCPYIIKLLNYYAHGQQFLEVLEKCDSDLENVYLTPDMRISAMKQLNLALVELHQLNYAHRDIKPSNLLVSRYQTLKLCDFGLAGRYPKNGGTTEYMPPECFHKQKTVSIQGDQWAFGITWLELIVCQFWTKFYRFLKAKQQNSTKFMEEQTQQHVSQIVQQQAQNQQLNTIALKQQHICEHDFLNSQALSPQIQENDQYINQTQQPESSQTLDQPLHKFTFQDPISKKHGNNFQLPCYMPFMYNNQQEYQDESSDDFDFSTKQLTEMMKYVVQPCILQQFLAEYDALPFELEIIQQCLVTDPDKRITSQQVRQLMNNAPLIKIIPKAREIEQKSIEPLILANDEQPLVDLLPSEELQSKTSNSTLSGLDAQALSTDWSDMSGFSQQNM